MRVVKFRVWDFDTNKFVSIKGMDMSFFMSKRYHFMENSEIKDSNGANIYEGDIVYLAGLGNMEIEFPFIDLYHSALEKDVGAILGNIYENKELLDD